MNFYIWQFSIFRPDHIAPFFPGNFAEPLYSISLGMTVIPRITDGKQMVMQIFFLGVGGGGDRRGGKQGAS